LKCRKKDDKKNYFFNDVAVVVPRHAAAMAEFQGLGTPGNSQPSRRAEKHLMRILEMKADVDFDFLLENKLWHL